MALTATRRKHPRAPLKATASCTLSGRRTTGVVWQVSEGGLILELPETLPAPTPIAVAFDLPDQGTHRAVVEMVWQTDRAPRTAPQAKRGLGAKFVDITPASRDAIAQYVKKMKQTFEQLQLQLALSRSPQQLSKLIGDAGLTEVRDTKLLKERVAVAIAHFHIGG